MRSGRASVFSVAGATVEGNLRLGRTSGATGNYTTRKEQTHAYNASCFSKHSRRECVSAASRVMALIVASVGINFILTGVKNSLPGLVR
jgi:hypothetical protein